MNNFGKKFYEHFMIIEDSKKKYTFKCLETNNTFTIYKKSLPQKFIICKCCGKKISVCDEKDYYKDIYTDSVERFLSETDIIEKRNLLRKIYYCRKKAGIPSFDFERKRCIALIEELNRNIINNEIVKKAAIYNPNEYHTYKIENDKNRRLFYKIKKVIPNLDNYEKFPEYKKFVLKEVKVNE